MHKPSALPSALQRVQAWACAPLAQRQQAFSPSSCLGGHYQPHMVAYAAQSREGRARTLDLGARWMRLLPAVSEGPHHGASTTPAVELCLPAVAMTERVPLFVYIHGGYWQELNAEASLFAAPTFVQRGIAFAAVDYTLAPQASIADIATQCVQLIDSLGDRAEALNLDSRRVVIAGSSAGAHLAALVHTSPRHALRWPSAATVLISGIYELSGLMGTDIDNALHLNDRGVQAWSPLLHDVARLPRSLVVWGGIETEAFKAHSHAMADALHAADRLVERREVTARNHFDVVLDLADANAWLSVATMRLFDH